MATPIIGNLLKPEDPLKPVEPLAGPAPSNTAAPMTTATAMQPPNVGGTTAEAERMTATSAASRDMTAATRTVDQPTETVQGQLGSMLESGSPYLQRARAGATQTANRRGLINSSMAAGAGEAAAIDAATPIAQADANIYNQAAGQNLQYRNQAESQNAQLGTQVNMQNATEANKAASQNAQLASQIAQSNADNNLKQIMQYADNATKSDLANIEANYKVLMQSNASASDVYKAGQANISAILMNKDLDAPAKNAAITQQLTLMKNGMAMIGGMSGMTFTDPSGKQVGLDGLLDFGPADAGGIGQRAESPALVAVRNDMQNAEAALVSAMNDKSGSRRVRGARQEAARNALAQAKKAYEIAAAEEAQTSQTDQSAA